jgi:hypothetical protein
MITPDMTQLRVTYTGRGSPDGLHPLHIGVQQAFAQDALADHASRPEQNDVHVHQQHCHPNRTAHRLGSHATIAR